MESTPSRASEEERRHKAPVHDRHDRASAGPGRDPGDLARSVNFLTGSGPRARPNAAARATAVHTLQRTYGNRAVQRSMKQSWPSKYDGASAMPEEGIWDFGKKLLGVDQIVPGIEKVVGKAKSGYEWAEKKVMGLFGGDDASKAPIESTPSSGYKYQPGGSYSPNEAWPSKWYVPELDSEIDSW